MATKLKFGLLLPHFCEYGSTELCVEGSKKAEAYGFDSVWVRDHLVFEPHGMEGEDNTHIEGLLILAAVATVCKKLILGTGTMISHRHPIHLAQSMAGLSTMCAAISSWVSVSVLSPMNSKPPAIPRRPCRIAPISPRSTPNFAAASGPVKRSATRTIITISRTSSSNRRRAKHSDLVRRRHAGFGAPRRGLLRRLDAWTYSHGDIQ